MVLARDVSEEVRFVGVSFAGLVTWRVFGLRCWVSTGLGLLRSLWYIMTGFFMLYHKNNIIIRSSVNRS